MDVREILCGVQPHTPLIHSFTNLLSVAARFPNLETRISDTNLDVDNTYFRAAASHQIDFLNFRDGKATGENKTMKGLLKLIKASKRIPRISFQYIELLPVSPSLIVDTICSSENLVWLMLQFNPTSDRTMVPFADSLLKAFSRANHKLIRFDYFRVEKHMLELPGLTSFLLSTKTVLKFCCGVVKSPANYRFSTLARTLRNNLSITHFQFFGRNSQMRPTISKSLSFRTFVKPLTYLELWYTTLTFDQFVYLFDLIASEKLNAKELVLHELTLGQQKPDKMEQTYFVLCKAVEKNKHLSMFSNTDGEFCSKLLVKSLATAVVRNESIKDFSVARTLVDLFKPHVLKFCDLEKFNGMAVPEVKKF